MTKKRKFLQILLTFLVVGADFLLGPGVLDLTKTTGGPVYRVGQAGMHPIAFLLQSLMLSLWPILLWVILKGKLKKRFEAAMGLRLRSGLQWVSVILLAFVLAAMAGVAIRRTGDRVYVLLTLAYYLVFVALAEEFVIRGACVYLLRDFSWQVRYLLPSFLFAMIHIFAFSGFAPLSWEIVRRFLLSEAFGLMASGCCFQLLKDWSGTLWVPVLIHAIVDYSVIFQ